MHTATSAQPSVIRPRANPKISARSARILARTIFRDMKDYGIPDEKILDVASELIGLVSEELKELPDKA